MRCVALLDWPKDRLRIQLLDDSTDETSARADAVAAELRIGGAVIDHVRRADRSGFKAGACAHGLTLTDEPFVAMLDADFRPPPNWLKRTVPLFLTDDRIGFVQSRCEFQNFEKNWLTRAQGLVQDGHYLVEQRSRAHAGWLFQFNGTGGIWRRATVEDAGGWSDYSLCEDLDLTVRAALQGWHGLFVSEPPIPGQVPEGIRDFRRQQRRWSNGFVQVAQKTVLPIWRSPWSLTRRVMAISLIAHQIFFPTAAIGLIAFVLGVILHGSLAPFAGMLEIIGIMTVLVALGITLPPYLALKRGTARRLCENGRVDSAADDLSRLRQWREDPPDPARAQIDVQAHAQARPRGGRRSRGGVTPTAPNDNSRRHREERSDPEQRRGLWIASSLSSSY